MRVVMCMPWEPPTAPPLPTKPPPPTSTTDLVALHKPSLVSAIRLAGDIWARAFFELNTEILENSFKDEALKRGQAEIENLKNNFIYLALQRHDIQFEQFSVSADGERAQVHVTAVWEVTVYRVDTTLCVNYYPPYEEPQTIYLEKDERGWMVYAIEFDNESGPQPQACP